MGMFKSLFWVLSFSLLFFLVKPVLAFDAAGTYGAQCASCHGATGQGDGPVGKLLSPPVAPLTTCNPAVVLNGKGKMPGYASKLSPPDADALCSYIKTLK